MKRAANQPIGGDLVLYGGVFVLPYRIPDAQTMIPQHSHSYPHLSAVVAGAVSVYRDGEMVGTYTAPALIRIPARVKHAFVSLVPETTVWCIHSQREGEDAVPVHEEHQFELED